MHYVLNEPVKQRKHNMALVILAFAGWFAFGLLVVACIIMQYYGAKLW